MDTEFLEQIKTFLPSYLTPENKAQLFQELNSFPDNYDYYLSHSVENTLQGDMWEGFPICDIGKMASKEVSGIILSNSCDIDLSNKSDRQRKVVFCPVISLEKYQQQLGVKKRAEDVENIVKDIKNQKITYLFYLPAGGSLKEDCIIFLDDVHSVFLDSFSRRKGKKIFTLGQYGFYLFLLKLSIHFTRFQEGIERFS
ncbi:MAG: hypothetical protein WCH04_19005 [Gammaproteobacteria bacterium]